MADYSVATTKDHLSSLIDKALAGEEVVITRHGKPTVAFRPVIEDAALADRQVTMEQLRAIRQNLPPARTTFLSGKAMDEAEGVR